MNCNTTHYRANSSSVPGDPTDPEDAVPLDQLIGEFQPAVAPAVGPSWRAIAVTVLVLAALAMVWRWTPLSVFASVQSAAALAEQAGASPWTGIALIAGYIAASFVLFPRLVLTVFAVLAFGPWLGFGLSLAGAVAATWVNYLAGRVLPRSTVRRLAGRGLNRISEILRRRSLLAVTALRLVPVAPFAIPGIVGGAVRMRLRDLLLGTAIGNLPGIAATTILADRLDAVLHHPRPVDYWLLGSLIVIIAAAAVGLRRFLDRVQVPVES